MNSFYRAFTGIMIGRHFEDVVFTLGQADVVDYVSSPDSKPMYMFENVSAQGGSNAIEI